MMEGKTVNALARSPSTFALTGRIVVPDQGFVVRIASHAAAFVQSGSRGRRRSACLAPSPLPAVEAPR
jgi:hypothetical protein